MARLSACQAGHSQVGKILCFHGVFLAPPAEVELSNWLHLASSNFSRPHPAGTGTPSNFPGKPPFLVANDRAGWGRDFFADDLGGAGRTSTSGAGTCSRNQIVRALCAVTGRCCCWPVVTALAVTAAVNRPRRRQGSFRMSSGQQPIQPASFSSSSSAIAVPQPREAGPPPDRPVPDSEGADLPVRTSRGVGPGSESTNLSAFTPAPCRSWSSPLFLAGARILGNCAAAASWTLGSGEDGGLRYWSRDR